MGEGTGEEGEAEVARLGLWWSARRDNLKNEVTLAIPMKPIIL